MSTRSQKNKIPASAAPARIQRFSSSSGSIRTFTSSKSTKTTQLSGVDRDSRSGACVTYVSPRSGVMKTGQWYLLRGNATVNRHLHSLVEAELISGIYFAAAPFCTCHPHSAATAGKGLQSDNRAGTIHASDETGCFKQMQGGWKERSSTSTHLQHFLRKTRPTHCSQQLALTVRHT